MACKATEEKENLQFIERLLHDVLVFTLSKCGLAEASLPTTDSEENSYKLPNFVESAGLLILTAALTKRDDWKRMFQSRRKSSGFKVEDMTQFITRLIMCHRKEGPLTKYFVMELSLSLSNEIMLFFFHERIPIDFNELIKLVSKIIVDKMESNQDVSKTTKELFVEFENISEYNRWMTDFLTKHTIPYDSEDEVTKLFMADFSKLWQILYDKTGFPETHIKRKTGTSDELQIVDLASALKNPGKFSEIKGIGIVLPSNDEPPGSESSTVREGKLDETGSTPPSNISAQSEQSDSSSELVIDDDMEQTHLEAEGASRGSRGSISKRKLSKKEEPGRKRS